MDTNLPPVRHSSTTLPTGGPERRRGGTLAVLGAGLLLVVVSFTVAYLLLGLYGPGGTANLASGRAPAAVAPQPVPTIEPSGTSEPPLPTEPFDLKNAVTGKCLRVVKDKVAQRTCRSDDEAGDKEWVLQRTRTVDGVDLYRIRQASGDQLCLDVPFFDVQPEGVVLGVFSCTSPPEKDNQEFRIQAQAADGLSGYILMNYKNQLCVDVSGSARDESDRKEGVDITLYRCQDTVAGYDDHLWTFS